MPMQHHAADSSCCNQYAKRRKIAFASAGRARSRRLHLWKSTSVAISSMSDARLARLNVQASSCECSIEESASPSLSTTASTSESPQTPLLEPRWNLEVMGALVRSKFSSIRVPASHSEATAVFCLHPTTIFTSLGILLLLLGRAPLGFTPLDAGAAILGAGFWALQEWFIHAKLLHSTWEWAGKKVHEGHHQQPYYHITIDPLSQVAPAMGVSFALFSCIAGTKLGQSATLAYWSMGLLYIYSHYIVHTRAVPRTKYWRTVRQHHMQHHCRNEDFWLSFCIPAVDILMGTSPNPADVPMTDLARAAVQKRQA